MIELTAVKPVELSVTNGSQHGIPVETAPSTTDRGPASSADMALFQNAMAPANVNTVSAENTISAENIVSVQSNSLGGIQCSPVEAGKPCFGDSILEGLDKIRTNSMDQISEINVAFNDGQVSPADVLKMQFEMNVWAMKQELFAKTVGSAERGVDTMLKSQ